MSRKQGQPSRASECAFDATRALDELDLARSIYAVADTIADRRQREEAMRLAHDRVGLAMRFCEFLLKRPAK